MIDIRPILTSEIESVKHLIPPGYDAPDWDNCYVIEDDRVLVGLIGMKVMLVAEPLYLKPGHALILHGACTWLDGFFRQTAKALGLTQWHAFITDEHKAFQQLIERYMPVSWYREKPGKWYTRQYGKK